MPNTLISIKRPAWLAQQDDQPIMISSTKMAQTSKPKQKVAPKTIREAMLQEKEKSGMQPIPAVLNAGEEVIPTPVVDQLGGSEGLTNTLNQGLKARGQAQLMQDRGRVGNYATGTVGGIRRLAAGTVMQAPELQQPAAVAAPSLSIAAPTAPVRLPGQTTASEEAKYAADAQAKQTAATTGIASAAASSRAYPASGATEAQLRGGYVAPTTAKTVAAPVIQQPAAVAAPTIEPIKVTPPPVVTKPTTTAIKPSAGLIESPAAKQARMAQMEDLQGRQGAERIAANQSAAQTGQTGAAYQTAMAQLQASQEGALGTASRDAAISNARDAEAKLMDAASMALSAGDYQGVNSMMSQAGLPAVDFTKVIAKEKQADLKAASDDLIDIAERFTESNPALAGILMDKAFALRGEMYNSVAGVDFDPAALSAALTAVDNDDYTNPAMQALVGKVAPTILDWFGTAEGQSSTYSLINSPMASGIFKKIADGTATDADMTQLGTVMALMFDNRHGVTMSDADMALLSSWGVWKDLTKPTASVKPVNSPSGQSPAPASAPVIPNIPVSSQPGVQAYQPGSVAAPVIAPIAVTPGGSPAGLDLSGATELTPEQVSSLSSRDRADYVWNRSQYPEMQRQEEEAAAWALAHPEEHAFNVTPFSIKGVRWEDGTSYARNNDGSTTYDGKNFDAMSDVAWNHLGYSAGSFDFEHQTGTSGFLLFGPGNLHATYAVDEDFYGINTTPNSDGISQGSGVAAGGNKIMNRATFSTGMQDKFEKMAKDETPFVIGGHSYTVDPIQPFIRDVLVGTTQHTSGSGAVGSQNWYADGLVVTDENGMSKVITFPVFASMWDNPGDMGESGQIINLGMKVWDPDTLTTQLDQV